MVSIITSHAKHEETPPPSMLSAAGINRMPRRRPFLGIATLLGAAAVDGQLIDGGAVSMTCFDPCACDGTTDDGQIRVFDNPSTGSRVSAILGRKEDTDVCTTGTLTLVLVCVRHRFMKIRRLESRLLFLLYR